MLLQKGEFEQAEKLVKKQNICIADAHRAQTDLLTKEAAGEDLAYSVTMMHGRDHLMTTLLSKDLMKHFIELYKRRQQDEYFNLHRLKKAKPLFEKISRNISFASDT